MTDHVCELAVQGPSNYLLKSHTLECGDKGVQTQPQPTYKSSGPLSLCLEGPQCKSLQREESSMVLGHCHVFLLHDYELDVENIPEFLP